MFMMIDAYPNSYLNLTKKSVIRFDMIARDYGFKYYLFIDIIVI